MSRIRIGASLLSANMSMLEREVKRAEKNGVDFIHADVSDGHFGPKVLLMSTITIKQLTKSVKIPIQVHCYVADPHNRIDEFLGLGCESIFVHVEASPFLYYITQKVHEAGMKVGVSLLPPTPPLSIEYILNEIDYVSILGVDPIGLKGQKFIRSMLRKISEVRDLIENAGVNVEISVDGGVNKANAHEIIMAGADALIAGTAIYGSDEMGKDVKALKRINAKALENRIRTRSQSKILEASNITH